MMKQKRQFLLIILGVFIFSTACLAQTPTETLTISGLKKQVEVRRDGRWIPYIKAENEADLYFTQGYITASDRLWQMDLYRRLAGGRTAEIFGKPALSGDLRWRKFGFEKIVKKSFENFSDEYKAVLENYARGVNAYIATLDKDTLPTEFKILKYTPEPWKATDSLLIGKILADGLSTSWYKDVTREKFKNLSKERFEKLFLEKTPYDVLVVGKDVEKSNTKTAFVQEIVLPAEFLELAEKDRLIRKRGLEKVGFYQEFNAASNNWVISGKKTLDGKPILANDPHLRPSSPSIWYLANLDSEGFRVSGVTFPGVPGVVLGHNQYIAWGATNLGPDVQDVFLEEFNSKNEYKTPDGLKKAKVRTEKIKVRKGNFTTETETQQIKVLETRNGPIIQDRGKRKLALKWTALDPNNAEFEAFYLLNRARNWKDFKAALKTYGGATQNFIYADTKGNIGFHNAGAIPIRKTGKGIFPYDGSKNEGKWMGNIPFEELPNSFNPPEGFIVTANQRIAGDSYKHFLGRAWASPFRARRIYDLIEPNNKLTVQSSIDIQNDIFSIPDSKFAREIVRLKAASPKTLKVLRGWDGKMSPEAKGAVLVGEIRREFQKRVLDGILGKGRSKDYRWSNAVSFTDYLIREKPAEWLPNDYPSYKALLMEADEFARKNLTGRLGEDSNGWTYGQSRKMNFPHPLSIAPLIGSIFKSPTPALRGSGNTPNVGAAVSMRHITVPGNWDQTRQGIAMGQSGDPKSKFWKDQLGSWETGNTPVFPFSEKAVKKASEKVFLFKPSKN